MTVTFFSINMICFGSLIKIRTFINYNMASCNSVNIIAYLYRFGLYLERKKKTTTHKHTQKKLEKITPFLVYI